MIRRAMFGLAFLALVAAFAGGLRHFAFGAALDQLSRRGEADLALAADRLTGALQRFRQVSVLAADRPVVRDAVLGSTVGAGPAILEMADKTGSLEIRVIDRAGNGVLAARGQAEARLAGDPAFERALDGALGLQHFWSEAFQRRVFEFVAPVFGPEGPVIGAVSVLVDVEAIEASWRGNAEAVFFTDAQGVIFVANRSELVFLTRSGDGAVAAQSREYPSERLAPFVTHQEVLRGPHRLWQIDGGRYLPAEALHLQLGLPSIGLTGEALLDVAPARQLADLQAAVAAALCLAFGALLFLATERRRTLALANQQLEARVRARTEDLERVNADLRREVDERTHAEARLQKAQADLVQAGKLSALGQMSAGISHELNQPLMAIRSFAENAEAFLARGKTEVAAQNLGRISDLARRMGRIIRNLRAFARQENEPIGDVDLVGVVADALEMAAAKLRQAEVTLDWQPPRPPVMVRGGEVRLAQVVLNLVSNAVDAMEGRADKRVELRLADTGPRVTLSVRDTGPGIAEPDRIFDPFYTTKQVGESEGMGLGLSISYGLVQSFGGAIRGRNHPEGGAIFTVELDRGLGEEAA